MKRSGNGFKASSLEARNTHDTNGSYAKVALFCITLKVRKPSA